MVGPWPHRPGTLRALITILKGPWHVICPPCRRFAPMEVHRDDLDRPYEPCPFVCSRCGVRAEIEQEVPKGFALTEPARRVAKPKPAEPVPAAKPGPWHRPSF